MIQKGIATFTLDYGKCPKWLFERMVKLSRKMILAIVAEEGADEFIKRIEMQFYQKHGINIVFEEEAADFIVERMTVNELSVEKIYDRFNSDFELGLKLVREKIRKSRFFITREALVDPESYIRKMLRENMPAPNTIQEERK